MLIVSPVDGRQPLRIVPPYLAVAAAAVDRSESIDWGRAVAARHGGWRRAVRMTEVRRAASRAECGVKQGSGGERTNGRPARIGYRR